MSLKQKIKEVFYTFDNDDAKRSISIYFFTYIGMLSLLVFGIKGLLKGETLYSVIIFSFFVVTTGLLIFLKRTKKIEPAAHLIVSLLFIFNLLIFAELGKHGTGYFWFYIFPLIAVFMVGNKKGTIYSIILITLAAIQIKYQIFEIKNTYDSQILSRLVFTYFVIVILTNIFEYLRIVSNKAFAEMYKEKIKLLAESQEQKEEIAALAEEESAMNEELKQQNEEMLTINNELEYKQRLIGKQNKELTATLEIVTKQQEKIQEINFDLKSSIEYAKTIQDALIPNKKTLSKYFNDFFLINKPKEAVSGDFYYVIRVKEWIIFAVADCTGHGVHGGFLTMLGITYLHEIMSRQEAETTGEALNVLREKFKNIFLQTGSDNQSGMDIALCAINTETNEMQYSGAYNPLFIIRNKKIIEYKATRNPIGVYPIEKPFETKKIQLQNNDLIYIFSDGYYDQIGGEKLKKFSKKRFKDILLELNNYPLQYQEKMLESIIENWRGKFEQVDDITIMGIKYNIEQK